MKNENENVTVHAEPRKLEKPVREDVEMTREELVTYTAESGGGSTGSSGGGGGITTYGP